MGLGFRRWSKQDKALASFARALELDPGFEKAARQKRLTEAALGHAPGEAPHVDLFQEEPLTATASSSKIALPKDDELFEDE
jgi:hypothetical protein